MRLLEIKVSNEGKIVICILDLHATSVLKSSFLLNFALFFGNRLIERDYGVIHFEGSKL